MDAVKVYEVLDLVKQGTATGINPETATFLKDKGLASILSNSDYRSSSSEVERLPITRAGYESQRELAAQHRGRVEELDGRLTSAWHRFWSSRRTLQGEQKEKEDEIANYQNAQRKADEYASEIKRLEGVQSGLERYTQINEGYLKLTPKADDVLTRLKARLQRLQGKSYQEFESEFEQVRGAIDYRYQRFCNMWNFLLEKDRGNRDETVQLAIALSKLPGDFDEIYNRFRVIHGKIWEMNWKDFAAYRIAANVVSQEGDINELWQKLLQTRNALWDMGAITSYALWSDAANIMKIPGATPIARYNEVGSALFGDYWKPNDDVPTRIQAYSRWAADQIAEQCKWNVFRRTAAATLARRNVAPSSIAHEYNSLKEQIHKSGWRDCLESRVATLILMGSTSNERVSRFGETFKSMRQKGWGDTIQWFPSAAAVSTMPGTVEENVRWLLDVYHKFGKQYNGDNTGRATSLLVGGHNSLPNAPNIWVNSNDVHTNDEGFDLSYVIAGAVIGDLIDNGNSDFSEGAVVGGSMGGFFDDD